MRWFDVKYGKKEDRRHVAQTAFDVSESKQTSLRQLKSATDMRTIIGYFKPLVEATAANGFTMKEVSADKALS